MKKLLLFAFLLPVAGWAQNVKVLQPPKAVNQPVLVKDAEVKDVAPKTVKIRPGNTVLSKKATINASEIGTTFYDLQTNSAIPRRVKLYSGGKVSVVWTFSNEVAAGYPDRGTAYNHFNGTQWLGQNLKRPETDRSGWPNIVSVNNNGVEREMIVSHYAPSSSVTASGGLFVMQNEGIGSYNFFSKIIRKPGGPLWPRMAASGDYVHMIANYTTTQGLNDDTVYRNGVRRPTVYFRYRVSDSTFTTFDKALPGYDSSRYGVGNSDAYSMDARDNHVAIVIGGTTADVALWKSDDYGATWTKTIVDTFAPAPFNPYIDTPFDTSWSNDGSVHVTLDKSGTAHVFYPRMRVLNVNQGDTSWTYFPGTNGIMYYNDKNKEKGIIAAMPDINETGSLELAKGTTAAKPSGVIGAAGYGSALATFPSAAVDDSGYIYMVYSAPNEDEITPDEQNYRDIFLVFSKDGGASWSKFMNLTPDNNLENVFASVARDADANVHMVWMQDDEPGTVLTNGDIQSTTPNKILYSAIPVADIKSGNVTDTTTSINSSKANDFVVGTSYPNPVSETMFIPVTMNKAANVAVKVMNVLGQEVQSQNFGVISAGNSLLNLNVSSLSKGVYFYTLTTGNTSVTQKIVVE